MALPVGSRRACAGVAVALAVLLAAPATAVLVEEIQAPAKVPRFEFLSQGGGIEPGSSGVYGFSMRNRYNDSMLNVSIAVEIYRYATVEPEVEVNLSDPADGSTFLPSQPFGPPPTFSSTRSLRASTFLAALSPGANLSLAEAVEAPPAAPQGVYFTRHRLEFDYANVTVVGQAQPQAGHFVMVSRGHLTDSQWASINYSDLEGSLAALNISGIVPDSSFSLKAPAPLWPLVLLAGATAAAGFFALAEFMVASAPDRHPRVQGALLTLAGKWHVARVSLAEELRARLGRRHAPK